MANGSFKPLSHSSPESDGSGLLAMLQNGLMAHQLNKLDEAKALYEQVLAKDSTNASALELLGLVHFSLCNYEQSLVYYLEAIQQNPTNPEVHHNIGNVLAELGRLKRRYSVLTRVWRWIQQMQMCIKIKA
jgi:tetratricopeptide (TPR) repeat protein